MITGQQIGGIAARGLGMQGGVQAQYDTESEFLADSVARNTLGRCIGVALTALTEAGFAIVPVEPTEAMLDAARDVPFISLGNGDYVEPEREDIYRAMIEAGRVK